MEPDNEGSQYCLVKKNSHKGKEVAVGTEPNTKQNNDSIINIEEDDTIVNDAQKIAVQNSSTPKFNLIQSANNEPISLRRNSSVKDKKDHRRVTHQPTLERKSSLSPTQAYLSDTADQYNSIGKKRCRMVRGKSIAVPITTTPQQCQLASKDDFRVSYTSLRSEDSSLVPDAHVKEQRRLEKMFREIQRRVHSPENSCSSGFLSPNDTVPDTHRSGARRSYPIENSSSLGRQDQEENKKTGSGYSIYYALPITRNDGVGRNRSVSISPMLYSDISSYLEGRTLIHSRRASFASPARGGRASVDSRIYSRRSSNATSVVDHHVHRGSRPRLSKIGKSVSLNPRFSSDVESFDPLLNSSRKTWI